MRHVLIIWCLVIGVAATGAGADNFRRILNQDEFAEITSGKRMTALGVSMVVTSTGGIEGRAFGQRVTGAWRWVDGFFCRDLTAGATVFPFNCQQVLISGTTIRFVADKGKGDVANLKLR